MRRGDRRVGRQPSDFPAAVQQQLVAAYKPKEEE